MGFTAKTMLPFRPASLGGQIKYICDVGSIRLIVSDINLLKAGKVTDANPLSGVLVDYNYSLQLPARVNLQLISTGQYAVTAATLTAIMLGIITPEIAGSNGVVNTTNKDSLADINSVIIFDYSIRDRGMVERLQGVVSIDTFNTEIPAKYRTAIGYTVITPDGISKGQAGELLYGDLGVASPYDSFVADGLDQMLELVIKAGDRCYRRDLHTSYINITGVNESADDWELVDTGAVSAGNVGMIQGLIDTSISPAVAHIAVTAGNPHHVTKAEVGLGLVPNTDFTTEVGLNTANRHAHANKAVLDATTDSFTPAKSAAIVTNSAKVGITPQQATDITAANAHKSIVSGNPHQVTKAEVGLNVVPNINFTPNVNDSSIHMATTTGNPHQVTKTEVGLGNVPDTDFTTDVNLASAHRNTITGNPHQVTKAEVGLSDVVNHDFTTEVNSHSDHVAIIVGNPHQVTKAEVGLGHVPDVDFSIEVGLANLHRNIVTGNPHAVTKEDVGLSMVPNVDCTNASNITSGMLPSSVVPPVVITDTHVVVNEASQLALVVNKGDIAVRTDQSRTYINSTGNNTSMVDWQELSTPLDSISSVNGQTGTVILTTNDIFEGLNLYYTEARVSANSEVVTNTSMRHVHYNSAILNDITASFTIAQADAIAANSAKVGITTDQANAIVANTAKVGITVEQSDAIVNSTAHTNTTSGNPHQVTKADVGLGSVPNHDFTSEVSANTTAQHGHVNKVTLDATTASFTVGQADAIIINTAKVGITPSQASAIVANTAKVGITPAQVSDITSSNSHRFIVTGNPHAVTKAEVGLGLVPNTDFTTPVSANTAARHGHANKTILDAITSSFTVDQANAIIANTAKVGITPSQATAIVANTAKVGITAQQSSDIILANDHRVIVAGNPHAVTKAEVGLSNVPNVDCTNASNITSGTLPSSVLPPLAITDTFVAASQAAQLALSVQKGDIAVRSDQSKTYINSTGDNVSMADWQELSTPTDNILSVNGFTGTVVLTTSEIDEGANLYYTEARVSGNSDVTQNTANRHNHSNKVVLDATTAAFTPAQASAIVVNSAKVGITTTQANAIIANSAKVGITPQQATDISAANTHKSTVTGNPHAVTKAEVGLGNVPNTDFTSAVSANTAARHGHANKAVLDAVTDSFTTEQAAAIIANTVKVGITPAQASAIVANTAKVGITTTQANSIVTSSTHAATVAGNPHQVTKTEIGLGNVPNVDFTTQVTANSAARHTHDNSALLAALTASFTTEQAAAIVANTTKVGITVAQANAIVANTAKVGITTQQTADITSANTHRGLLTGNPHHVTKAEVGLSNVPNVDCTNASNITSGTLPSSVLPALAITDTYVVATEIAQLALIVQKGDIAVRSDLGRTYINSTGSNLTLSDWQELSTPTDSILSINGLTGVVILTTSEISEGDNLYYTEARVSSNASVAANTAARHGHSNKVILDAVTASFTTEQAAAIIANTAKVGISVAQANAIVANSAKVGISAAQASAIVASTTHSVTVTGNPHAVNKTDIGLGNVPNVDFTSEITLNTTNRHAHGNKAVLDATTDPFTTAQVNAIAANSAKVGITVAQANAIVANTAKVGITTQQTADITSANTHRGLVSGNPHAVTKAEIGLGNVPNIDFTIEVASNTAARHGHSNKALLDAVTASFTTAQANAIVANTAKVGITVAQADAIIANSAKVGITPQQATDITAANTHKSMVTGNPHAVTKAEVGLSNVPNVDCTNASNITSGTLPSSVLPALAITDTFVIANQAAQLTLVVQKGDIAVRSDQNRSYINRTGNNVAMTDWQELSTPTDSILSVNGLTGTVVLTTSNLIEGTNLYYTEARVTANVNVTANTAARHTHSNKALLDAVTASFTAAQASAIVANTAKVGITTAQANAIVANTAKVGITTQQATDITSANTHRGLVSGNPHQVTKTEIGLSNVPNTDFTTEVNANTAARHAHANKVILDAVTSSFTTEQADAIVINTAKVGITPAQASAIVANTAKVGITAAQTSAIEASTTHDAIVAGNPHQVTKVEVGLSNVPNVDFTAEIGLNTTNRHNHSNKTLLDSVTASFTTEQASAIVANTAKVGITVAQANAIVVNTAKVGITTAQTADIVSANTHRGITTGNPHQVTKTEIGLSNVPNVDCTNASNITSGTLPSSVLPALAITDTYVVATQVAQLALVVQKGDIAVRSDQNRTYINRTGSNVAMTDWQELSTPTDAISSINGFTGTVVLTTSHVAEGTNLYYTDARVSSNSSVAANTAARHGHSNKLLLDAITSSFTVAQADAIVANTAKVGITVAQANAIIANSAKIGITTQQATDIVSANTHRGLVSGNPHQVTKTEIGLSNVPNIDFTSPVSLNTAARHSHVNSAILDATNASFTTTQASAIVTNSAKVGITVAQADAIVANTAKVGITPAQANAIIASTAHDATVSGNPHHVTKADVGLGLVSNTDFTADVTANTAARHGHGNKTILDAVTASFTTEQASAIIANTAKVGITVAQADAIVANTAKVGITTAQANAIVASTAHDATVSGNPHHVSKSDVGLSNVPNVDCTNASNITSGTLPSSVLPALSITDTYVVATQVAQLTLVVQKGDIAVRSDQSKTYINRTGNNTAMTDWQELSTPTDSILSVNGLTGVVILTTSNIAEGTNLYYTEARVNANTSVAANTAARHGHSNKALLDAITASFTTEQAAAIVINTAKVGITVAQANAIVTNTAKIGITAQQATDITSANTHRGLVSGNPHAVTKAEIGLGSVPNTDFTTDVNANTAARHSHSNKTILDAITSSFTTAQANAIVINTAKVGITVAQANAIVANTAKIGITAQQATDITSANTHRGLVSGNPHAVTKSDIGLSLVPNTDFTIDVSLNTANRHNHSNKVLLDAVTASFTTAQADAIIANTAKVGITTAQANAIIANTAKVGISPQQTADITSANSHRGIVTGNPHAVTKAEVGLGNVPNVDCTNASNITSGTLPSSVLPSIAITDTYVVATQVAQLALIVQKGDIAVRSDQNRSYINRTGNNTAMTDWQELSTPTDSILSVNGKVGTVILSTSDIGEGSNLYYTEARVNANTNVTANTVARHTHANKTALDSVSGSNTGDQTSVIGNAGTATKLATARQINGVPFDGSANINIAVGTGDVTLIGSQTLTNKTVEAVVLTKSITEQVYNLVGNILDAENGTIQTKVLTANTTFTSNLADGQSLTLTLTSASLFTVTWPTISWVSATGNVAPMLTTASVFVFWKIGATLYGTLIGSFE